MPLPAGTPPMSALTETLRARLPVAARAPVHLGVADPVERAHLGRLADHLEVLLDRGLVGDGHVEPDDHRHADAHGLALERHEARVGLLVQRQRAGAEPGLVAVLQPGRVDGGAGDAVGGGGLERGPRDPVGLVRRQAGPGRSPPLGPVTWTVSNVPAATLSRSLRSSPTPRGVRADVARDLRLGLLRHLGGGPAARCRPSRSSPGRSPGRSRRSPGQASPPHRPGTGANGWTG